MALDDPHGRPPEPPGADGTHAGRGAAGVSAFAGDEVLACGRLLSRVWEQAQDAGPTPDPHPMSCPYCRDAVEGLAPVNAATRALRTETSPGLHALVDRIMTVVRAEVRLGRLLPLADPVRDLRIAESAAAKVLRRAADAVPGVRAATCRLVRAGQDSEVRVTMTLAADLDRPLTERVHQVRRSVLDAAGRELGLIVAAVDITVVDVLETGPAPGPGLSVRGGAS
ncbi:hypothetical protein [Streptomyces cadmiisoli]|uniref:hypothetical protein n=1 Tax=Streptomyces cadmiisoli TaxID=2184053 RepID=UPI003D73F966